MTHDPEYCRRVAEACGIALLPGRALEDPEWCWIKPTSPDVVARKFCPDVDWNDAMFAAEEFGRVHALHLAIEEDVAPSNAPNSRGFFEGLLMRGPRAICEAILKLKEGEVACDGGNESGSRTND